MAHRRSEECKLYMQRLKYNWYGGEASEKTYRNDKLLFYRSWDRHMRSRTNPYAAFAAIAKRIMKDKDPLPVERGSVDRWPAARRWSPTQYTSRDNSHLFVYTSCSC